MRTTRRTNLPDFVRPTQYALLLASEAAWLYAWVVALGGWLGESGPLIDLPALLGILVLAAGVVRLTARRGWPDRRARTLVVLLALASAVAVTLAYLPAGDLAAVVYAPGATSLAGRLAFALALVALLWWRGIALGREAPSLAAAQGRLRWGVLATATLLVLLAFNGQAASPQASALVAPVLVIAFAGLLGVPLARVADAGQHARLVGEARLAPSGPWLAMLLALVLALLGVALLLARLLAFERIEAFFDLARGPLDAVVWAVVFVIAFPFGLLVQFLANLMTLLGFGKGQMPPSPNPADATMAWLNQLREQAGQGGLSPELVFVLKAVGLVVVVAVVMLLLAWAVRGPWSVRDEDEVEEVRDFVWQWPGLDALAKRALANLRRVASGRFPAGYTSEPADAREAYRRFLGLGTTAGARREPAETPLEYRDRLTGPRGLPGAQDVNALTAAYMRERYARPSTLLPDPRPLAAALARLRALWRERVRSGRGEPI
ncbi:MAG: DUF4129 domain-containing protein [Chloroflexota bacterium]